MDLEVVHSVDSRRKKRKIKRLKSHHPLKRYIPSDAKCPSMSTS
jgi:hypothetical protein